MTDADVPVGAVPPAVPVTFTDEQLRAIHDRIERIDQHFDACCAYQRDGCRYRDEFDRLYDVLHLAGVPEEHTPCHRPDFEAWLASRPPVTNATGK